MSAFTLTRSRGACGGLSAPGRISRRGCARSSRGGRRRSPAGPPIPAAIYRYQCDAAFPLSDHADFADLLRFVETGAAEAGFHGPRPHVKEFRADVARTRSGGMGAGDGRINWRFRMTRIESRKPLAAPVFGTKKTGVEIAETSAFPSTTWERGSLTVRRSARFCDVAASESTQRPRKLEKVELLKNYFAGR